MARLPFEDLPEELQKRYGYDPAKVAAERAKRAAKASAEAEAERAAAASRARQEAQQKKSEWQRFMQEQIAKGLVRDGPEWVTKADDIQETDIEDVDIDDPTFESLLVGGKVKVLLKDVDLMRWRQNLIEDRKSRERAVASVFASGDAHAMEGEFAGMNDVEVVAYLVGLAEDPLRERYGRTSPRSSQRMNNEPAMRGFHGSRTT